MDRIKTKAGKIIRTKVANVARAIQFGSECIAIAALCALCVVGFIDLFIGFWYFLNEFKFINKVLHALEILFIAPIPILIVYSFRKYILSVAPLDPEDVDESASLILRIITAEVAKKAFITSLIGITSTFILSRLFAVLTPKAAVEENIQINAVFFIGMGFALIFLCILIYLYNLLINHKPDDDGPKSNDGH